MDQMVRGPVFGKHCLRETHSDEFCHDFCPVLLNLDNPDSPMYDVEDYVISNYFNLQI